MADHPYEFLAHSSHRNSPYLTSAVWGHHGRSLLKGHSLSTKHLKRSTVSFQSMFPSLCCFYQKMQLLSWSISLLILFFERGWSKVCLLSFPQHNRIECYAHLGLCLIIYAIMIIVFYYLSVNHIFIVIYSWSYLVYLIAEFFSSHNVSICWVSKRSWLGIWKGMFLSHSLP